MGDDFEVIVVGAGMAGCSAAIRLAKAGVQVLLIERGDEPGAKNLSGGVLWGHDLDKIVPEWKTEMPLERHIVSKRIGFLTSKRAISFEYDDHEWGTPPYNAHSVLRAKTDAWLAKKAEEAGATVINQVPVEKLNIQGEKVHGVFQGGEPVGAPITIICDGVNTRTTLGTFIRKHPRLDESHTEIGVKEVYRLPRTTIEDRFLLTGDNGCAQEWVLGFLPRGITAGGFLYTNKDTLSIGIIASIASLKKHDVPSHEIIERFKLHPSIAPYVAGAELVEYGAKLIPDGAVSAPDRLWGDGFLVAGDAAGFVFSNGIVIQGMNYAISSGILAAETAIQGLKNKDFSAASMAAYGARLEQSHILSDFEKFRGTGKVKWNERLYSDYPQMLTGIFHDMMTENGQPKAHIRNQVLDAFLKSRTNKIKMATDVVQAALEM
jgi:electron transfer flavoprotein-quinone oxidoreductase